MKSFALAFIIFLLEIFNCYESSRNTLKILIISPSDDKFPFSLNQLKAVAHLAKETIESEDILQNYELIFDYFDSECDPKSAQVKIVQQIINKCQANAVINPQSVNNSSSISGFYSNLSAIFGPICSYVLSAFSRINLHIWKAPIITLGAFAQVFRMRNEEEYLGSEFKYMTAAGYNYQNPSELIIRMYQQYKWKNVVFITDSEMFALYYDFLHCRLFHTSLDESIKIFRKSGGTLHYRHTLFNISTVEESAAFIFKKEFKDNSVFIFCLKPELLKQILLLAYKWNFNNGEYVFINVDLFNDIQNLRKPWKNSGNSTGILKSMYKFVFTVTLKPITGKIFDNFTKQVKEISRSVFNYSYNISVNNFGAAFYDSIMLYTKTLNRLLKHRVDIRDSSIVSDAMKNITFMGISGNVTIDSYGDRNSEYVLLDMDPDTNEFREVAVYNGITKIFTLSPNTVIDWGNKNNQAPPDSPTCRYDNEKCLKKFNTAYYFIGAMFFAVAVISAIGGTFIFRHVKFKAELKAMNWLIPCIEIESLNDIYRRKSKNDNFPITSAARPLLKKKKINKISRSGNSSREFLYENLRINNSNSKTYCSGEEAVFFQSNLSIDSIGGVYLNKTDNCKLYGRYALYKGSIVALKEIKREKRVDVTRELLLEIKKVKDLNNNHACRLIGVCLDWPNQFIVYEYCSKGSLKDILAQKQLVLDWMFKYSLIQDICRAMIYIHHTVGPHGNLKSSNCVVDSRFVLKITDFGLPSLQGCDKNAYRNSTDEEYYSDLLWISPERLRTNNCFINSTFKSDIYSFAIICQEIIFRRGHFYIEGCEKITNYEKVEKVKRSNEALFRPTLYVVEGCTEHLVKIVENAWNENPSARPDFQTIKNEIRKFNRCGDSGNLLDNLLSRMEQYANNLEGLVAQKTEQYLEEKRRAETLLYSMLPKSVAHQLIRKENVIAESYEMVTVYFSDIVGFTSLSAESTPMQVVAFLNKLYTTFDKIIERFDVYKVETIGDAYVVCSGLPTPNGNNHAREIGRMAIAFLNELFTFVIPHRPDKQLKLRIGIHSGPVCAGVVGLKMPRYCLFGDTVNTSSRMESSGLPLKIHISESTKNILRTFNSFVITERGYVEMKGKGLQLTFWLHGEGDTIVDQIPLGAVVLSDITQNLT